MSWMSMMPPASLELLDVDGVVFPVRADELHEGDAVEGRFRLRPRVSEPNDEPVLVAADVEDDLVFHEVCRPVPLLHLGGALIARRLHLLDPRHERGLCVANAGAAGPRPRPTGHRRLSPPVPVSPPVRAAHLT